MVRKLIAWYGGWRVCGEAESGRESGTFLHELSDDKILGKTTVKFAWQGSPEIGKWEVRDSLSLVAHRWQLARHRSVGESWYIQVCFWLRPDHADYWQAGSEAERSSQRVRWDLAAYWGAYPHSTLPYWYKTKLKRCHNISELYITKRYKTILKRSCSSQRVRWGCIGVVDILHALAWCPYHSLMMIPKDTIACCNKLAHTMPL